MKILFVSALLPYPLHSGGQVRIYNLLKALSERHEITLYAFIRDFQENNLVGKLNFCQKVETVYRGHAWQPNYVISSVLGKYPFLFSTYSNGEMSKKLDRELKQHKYDLVHIEPSYVWPSLPKTQIPLVVSEHNIESTIYEGYVKRYPVVPLRPFLYLDVLKLRYWETQVWQRANQMVTVSEADAAIVKKVNRQVTVVPNGIDPATFPFKPKNEINPALLTFLFVGNFSWLQNRDALRFLLRQLWPGIKSKFPGAQLRVVGRELPAKLELLAQKSQVQIPKVVTEITQEYQKTDILLAPIRIGGGTKFKILEAMASGLPVVATKIGAQGLDVADRRELLLADDREQTLRAIGELLDNRKRKALVEAARKRIETSYTWQEIARRLETAWQKAYESC